MTETFMNVDEHFKAILADLPQELRELHDECKHVRAEVAYVGPKDRNFVVYEMSGRSPLILDRIYVNDFVCDSEGASCEVTSKELGKTMWLDYIPQRLFTYPILMWLPVHTKLRWSAPPSDPYKGSLAFPVTIRTKSRFHLRERDVVYCETGPAFGKEFDTAEV